MILANWIDYLFIITFVVYGIKGYYLGFVGSFLELMTFVASFTIGLKWYLFLSSVLSRYINLPHGVLNAISFFIIVIVLEVILKIIIAKLYPSVRKLFYKDYFFGFLGTINHILGIIPGLLSCVILAAFVVTLFVALPVSPAIAKAVLGSNIGGFLVSQTQRFDWSLKDVFGEAFYETVNFLTIESGSNETISLRFVTDKGIVDKSAEQQMFLLLNKERSSRGFSKLVFDETLARLAREHGKDMLKQGYFSHFTQEGFSPFERMNRKSISYLSAGENLAFASTASLAMEGLMNSPGHRANILSPAFHKTGIGVIDAGIYG